MAIQDEERCKASHPQKETQEFEAMNSNTRAATVRDGNCVPVGDRSNAECKPSRPRMWRTVAIEKRITTSSAIVSSEQAKFEVSNDENRKTGLSRVNVRNAATKKKAGERNIANKKP